MNIMYTSEGHLVCLESDNDLALLLLHALSSQFFRHLSVQLCEGGLNPLNHSHFEGAKVKILVVGLCSCSLVWADEWCDRDLKFGGCVKLGPPVAVVTSMAICEIRCRTLLLSCNSVGRDVVGSDPLADLYRPTCSPSVTTAVLILSP